MAAILQLVRRTTNAELVMVLESALAEAKAGTLKDIACVLMDFRDREHVLVTGAYRKQKGLASNAGFMLQAMAADSTL